MPPRSSRPQYPGHVVTAVIVSHDGARWLPDCLAALAAQSRPPQRVVAVDTASTDSSRRLLGRALGTNAVVRAERQTGLGAAIQAGLDAFQGAPALPGVRGGVVDWVWVLHDDCAPEPSALAELLAAATASPSVAVWGPKLMRWDAPGHLAEVGVTVNSSGRRQTGLERDEVDQGQHDDVGDVLAVGTAGMLVRRDIWDRLGGLDPALPLFSDDVDFGWRANAAGERVRVAPRAVVRHVGALAAGLRAADATTGRPGAAAHEHGLQTVLANTSPALVPALAVRYVVETLLRALGLLLLVRRPAAAGDEIVGTARVLARPWQVLAARRRRAARTVPHAQLRGLLAPAGQRWRHLTDAVLRLRNDERAGNATPAAPVLASAEPGPVAAESEALRLDDARALLRALQRPAAALVLALTVLSLIGFRHLLGGDLHGGRLLPPAGGAGDLWHDYLDAFHPVGLGSTAVAPPYLGVLALVSTLLLGKVWLAVELVLVGALPLAGLAAYWAAAAVVTSRRLRIWAALGYVFLTPLTAAVAGGRIDVVLALLLLPLVVRVVAAAVRARAPWHRCAAAAVLLAAAGACAPLLWPLAALALAGALGWPGRRSRAVRGAAVLGAAFVLLLPWSATALVHPERIVRGGGLPEWLTSPRPPGAPALLLQHPGGPGAPPLWVVAPLLLAAFVGWSRRQAVGRSRTGLLLAVTGSAAAVVVSRFDDATAPGAWFWPGVAMAVADIGLLVSALVAADGARRALRRHSFGWRQPAVAGVAGAALVATAVAGIGWLVRGAGGPLDDRPAGVLPVFAAAEIGLPSGPRVLALTAPGGTVHYTELRRPSGLRLGDADIAGNGSPAAAAALGRAVRAAAAGQATAVPDLTALDLTMVVVPPDDPPALRRLADVDGLARVPTNDAVVWTTQRPAGELLLRSGSAAKPLPARGGHADLRLPSSTGAGRLVLAEPRSSDWHAALDGHRLVAATAGGWAQAWLLPAGGGHLVVSRGGGRGAWYVLQLLAWLVALALSVPARRGENPPAAPAPDAAGAP